MLRNIIHTRRLDRQHTGQLIHHKITPSRSDILTLLFLIYAAPDDTGDSRADSRKRVCAFIDEANDVLKSLHMWEIYPVNPYESFLLLCLMTEDPVCAFNDVWEMSYDA